MNHSSHSTYYDGGGGGGEAGGGEWGRRPGSPSRVVASPRRGAARAARARCRARTCSRPWPTRPCTTGPGVYLWKARTPHDVAMSTKPQPVTFVFNKVKKQMYVELGVKAYQRVHHGVHAQQHDAAAAAACTTSSACRHGERAHDAQRLHDLVLLPLVLGHGAALGPHAAWRVVAARGQRCWPSP